MKKKISKKLNSTNIICLIVLGLLLPGCSTSKTIVKLNKEKKATLGNVGLICSYYAVGLTPKLLDTKSDKEAIEELRKRLSQADPAPVIAAAFSNRITPLIGATPTIISENQLEGEDFTSLGKRLNVDSLVVIRTWDFTTVSPPPDWSVLPPSLRLSLNTEAKLIDTKTDEILWHKKVNTFWDQEVGDQNIGQFPRDFATIKRDNEFIVNVNSIKKANDHQIPYIVRELAKDWEDWK